MIDYVKLAIGGFLLLVSFSTGWYIRNLDYQAFKSQIKTLAEKQEAHVESIQKQHELVTKGIANEYEAKLALLRNYYANGVRQPNTSKLSNFSNATPSIDDFTSNGLLVKCAETTQQLVSLQQWLNEQIAIK